MTDQLPKEVSRGVMMFGPVAVEVVQLDDGRRLIAAEGLTAVLNWLGYDAGPAVENEEGKDAAG